MEIRTETMGAGHPLTVGTQEWLNHALEDLAHVKGTTVANASSSGTVETKKVDPVKALLTGVGEPKKGKGETSVMSS